MLAVNASDMMTQMIRLCAAPKMNTRQTIQALKRRIKPMALMLGTSLSVRARAFGDGPDRAAVRTLKQVRAFRESMTDVITRG